MSSSVILVVINTVVLNCTLRKLMEMYYNSKDLYKALILTERWPSIIFTIRISIPSYESYLYRTRHEPIATSGKFHNTPCIDFFIRES
jgi:hypothetical protein